MSPTDRYDRLRWSVQLQVAPGRIIKYKYLRVSKDKDGQWVQWEEGQDREFCWNGASVAHDDGDIHGFDARLQLPAKTTARTSHGDNSVKAHVSWMKHEEVPKHQWTCDMFDQMGLVLKDVESRFEKNISDLSSRFEKNISDLSRRMEESETFLKHHRRILLTLENKLDDVEEKVGHGNFLQLIEQGLQDSKLSQKHQDLEHDVACLQQRMRNFSALIASNDLRFQKFQDVMDSHAKSLAGLKGQLSHLPTLGRPQRLAQSWKTWKVSWLLWLLWAKCRKAPETGLPSLLRLLQCLANRPQRLPRLTSSPPLHQKLPRTRPWRTGAHRSIIPIYYNIARSFRLLLGIKCTTSCSCWSETTMNGLKGWLIGQPAP